MSTIRDNAHKILDAALPDNTVITSNGATASKYTEMTGIPHTKLIENWKTGGKKCHWLSGNTIIINNSSLFLLVTKH